MRKVGKSEQDNPKAACENCFHYDRAMDGHARCFCIFSSYYGKEVEPDFCCNEADEYDQA